MSARKSTPSMPPMPPPSGEEQAQSRQISEQLRDLIIIVRQDNLDRAVVLAQMASRGRLPQELQEHFGELGRRYAELVRNPAKQKAVTRSKLRIVEGGAR